MLWIPGLRWGGEDEELFKGLESQFKKRKVLEMDYSHGSKTVGMM